ncbi:MAG TPA: DUF2892 domain-containing protein [Chloroflexota bacterium]|nr:DUF2892 domain-containing protein [Chloroflexota bacterium]
MSDIITFMNGGAGRAIRIVLGVALIGYGLLELGGSVGTILAVVGLIPLVMGLWGRCLVDLIPHQTSSVR